jgi:hypothetical protein
MSTQRKIDSARANGAKSHGPITEQGRKTSSMNALKHGLTARTVILSNENGDEYTVLLDSYVDNLQPIGPVEMDLVLEMVNAKWQQRRFSNIESQLFEEYMERAKEVYGPSNASHHRETLEQTAGFRIMAESTALTMLNRMKSRLERTYSRALNNLLRLRRLRESTPTASDKDKNEKGEKRTQSQDRTPVTIHKSALPEDQRESNPPAQQPPVPSTSEINSDRGATS